MSFYFPRYPFSSLFVMLRGPYARASAADRARIVQCADDGGDWKQLCATLQVNPKTAYVRVKAGAEKRRPHCRWSPQSSHGRVSGRPVLNSRGRSVHYTQRTEERLLNDFEVRMSVSSIHNCLEELLFTLKKVHYQVVEAHNPQNKALRLECVSADKYAHVCKTRLSSGWMKQTLTCIVSVPEEELQLASELWSLYLDQKGPNVHMIGAITNFKVTKDWFADMLQHLPQGSTSTYK